ncbi:MAG: ABC transporter substrate-binding protein [Chloroflexota bacterium]|nr:ABC transporter substrate-binding protein [Chloroflexota bacterium]
MSRPWRGIPVLSLSILLLVALLLAVACGPAATPTPTPAPTPTKAAVATPTPTTVAATPTSVPPAGQSGTVTHATVTVYTVMGDPSTAPYLGQGTPAHVGIRDRLFRWEMDPAKGIDNAMGPYLAKSWETSPDGKTVIIRLNQGIKWVNPGLAATQGMDFGEFTAEDVVWTINRHNATTNKDTTAGDSGQLASFFEAARAVDKYTVEIPLVQPVFYALPLSEAVVLDAGTIMENKKVFDLLGPDKIKDVVVGTGPFIQKEWIPNERVVVEATPTNWLKASSIKEFRLIQVPEAASRIAMLESGQADTADMDFGKVKILKDKGLVFMATQTEGDTENASVVWSGNLWETVHAKTGAALEPWKSAAYAQDYPWIGCPWGDKCPTDTDNPAGMSDMEQARLVRWALSYAIDRDAIVSRLQGGLGSPIYIEYMGPLYPGWDPNRTVTAAQVKGILEKHACTGADCKTYGVTPAEPDYKWPWKIAYNPKEAERLLDLAGYKKKADGTRFTIKLNKYKCETGEVCLEQADAVAAGWESIGVKTDLLTEDYGAVVSPRMRTREQFWPVVKNCSVESAHNLLDWPMPPADGSMTRPGWGCGFEDVFSAKMIYKVGAETNKANREAWHMEVTDWMYYWQLYNGVAQQPRGVAANPKKIKAWKSPSTQDVAWHRPEFIELVK